MFEIRLYLLTMCLLISQPLVFSPEYNIFCGDEYFEQFTIAAAAEKCSEKKTFLKFRKILKGYKSKRNLLQMLKGVLF